MAFAQPSVIDWNVVEEYGKRIGAFLWSHPLAAVAIASWLVYFVIGTAAISTLRVRYKDRAAAPFSVLLLWNVLEITCGNVWRIQRKYWPSLPIRGLSDSGEVEQLPKKDGE